MSGDPYIKENERLEAEIARLRDLLAWNGINPDAMIESAKGTDKRATEGKEGK